MALWRSNAHQNPKTLVVHNRKTKTKPYGSILVQLGWDGWVRTIEMPESKSGALPLGYIPIFARVSIVSQKSILVNNFLK